MNIILDISYEFLLIQTSGVLKEISYRFDKPSVKLSNISLLTF